MRRLYPAALSLLAILHVDLLAQFPVVQGNLTSIGSDRLSILQVFPDSVPQISLIFRAENQNGEALFGLKSSALTVEEDQKPCKIIDFRPLSEGMPLVVNMVLDQSTSMYFDVLELNRLKIRPQNVKVDSNGQFIFPKRYTPPLIQARNAIQHFIEKLNLEKDKLGYIGFSNEVKLRIPPTQNKGKLIQSLANLEAAASTAFYDALMVALQNYESDYGMKVIIALTDGNDNSSVFTFDDVVDLSKEKEIPIYIIGLGEVNADSLNLLALKTDGQFFYAPTANMLDSTYQIIQNRINAFYELIYESRNLTASDTLRSIYLGFMTADSTLLYDEATLRLYPKLRQRLIEISEQRRQTKNKNNALALLGFISVAAVGAGLVFFTFRPKKQKHVDGIMLLPNPADTSTIAKLKRKVKSGKWKVISQHGHNMFEEENTTSELQLNVGSWPTGTYVITFTSPKGEIQQTNLLVQH
jgi:hypothetical protein